VYVALALGLIAITHSVVGVAVALLVAAAAAAALAGLFFQRAGNVGLVSVSWRGVWGIGINGFPFVAAALLIQVYTNADSVMLQFMKGERIVGLYAASYKIVLSLLAVSGLITWGVYPRLVAVFRSDRDQFDRLVQLSFRALLLLALPAMVGGIAVRHWLVSFAFGPAYSRSADVLAVLLVLLPLTILNSTLGSAMAAAGRQASNAVGVGIAAIGTVALGLLLIPRFEMIGAALASVVAEVVVAAYMLRSVRGTLDVSKLYGASPSPLLSAGVMGATMILLPAPPVLGLAAGMGVYLSTLLLTGGLRARDIRQLMILGGLYREFESN
jgi:O-antigen/teichoic acid export membrane protein